MILSDEKVAAALSRFDRPDEGCWIWQGSIGFGGYGMFSAKVDGVTRGFRAHRLIYESFFGPIPEGLELDHLCSTPPCVRPSHLEPVTHAENIRRAIERRGTWGRGVQPTCRKGHEFTPENTGWNRTIGARFCLTCRRDAARERYARTKATA